MFVHPLYGRWNRPFFVVVQWSRPWTILVSSREDIANGSWHCLLLVMDDPFGRIGDVSIFCYSISIKIVHVVFKLWIWEKKGGRVVFKRGVESGIFLNSELKKKKPYAKQRRFARCNGSSNKFVTEPWIDKNWKLED